MSNRKSESDTEDLYRGSRRSPTKQRSTSGKPWRRCGPRVAHRIAFVLGKPPTDSSILPEVIGRLRRQGFDVATHLPHEAAEPLPPWLFDARLVVQRGLNRGMLAALRRLEEAGVRCCNPIGATMAVQDRLAVSRRLAVAHLPVPSTTSAPTWEDVAAMKGHAVVVKARDASLGRGSAVLLTPDGTLPPSAPFDGPYVVQDLVPGDGWDRKLYVAGGQVRGLLKLGWPPAATPQRVRPLHLTRPLIDLGLRVAPTLGLEIYGVDLVVGSADCCIIDVNPFPGFRGIPRAARLVARHIQSSTMHDYGREGNGGRP